MGAVDWKQLGAQAAMESPRVRVGSNADDVIRRLHAKGWSYRGIADWLSTRGVKVSHAWVGLRVHALGLSRSDTCQAHTTVDTSATRLKRRKTRDTPQIALARPTDKETEKGIDHGTGTTVRFLLPRDKVSFLRGYDRDTVESRVVEMRVGRLDDLDLARRLLSRYRRAPRRAILYSDDDLTALDDFDVTIQSAREWTHGEDWDLVFDGSVYYAGLARILNGIVAERVRVCRRQVSGKSKRRYRTPAERAEIEANRKWMLEAVFGADTPAAAPDRVQRSAAAG